MRYTMIVTLCLAAWAQTAGAQIVSVMPSAQNGDLPIAGPIGASAEFKIPAQKGLNWLLKHKGDVDMETLALMRDINETYCHDPRIDDYIYKIIHKLQPEMAKSPFRRLMDGNTMYAYPDDVWQKRFPGPYTPDDLLIMSIYCDIHPLPDQTELRVIYDINPERNEILPTLLFTMALLEKKGCRNREKDKDFGTVMQKLAEQIAKKQSSAESENTYADRIGCLEFSGYPALVQQDWIRNIVTRQLASGAWPSGRDNTEDPTPGATIRSVWALTRYIQECPLDPGQVTFNK